MDDRFSFDDRGTINGVVIYIAPEQIETCYRNTGLDLFDKLRDVLADKTDDFFAELE